MDTTADDSAAITDTRLVHEVHRQATALLADAAGRHPAVPADALARLRDFVVAHLRHHHETEDRWLWPQVTALAPDAARELGGLSEEHDRLDAALDRLAAVPDADRAALHEAAAELRDSVSDHLAHEEPVLFPVLRAHFDAERWQAFAQRVIETTPPVEGQLMVGFLDEVGTPAEVELVLAGMPEPVRELLPVLREQATAELRVLRGAGA